jgi:hypothetical protein
MINYFYDYSTIIKTINNIIIYSFLFKNNITTYFKQNMTTKLELSKDHFFLHSFLDENIGDNKGNDMFITFDKFERNTINSEFHDSIISNSNVILF